MIPWPGTNEAILFTIHPVYCKYFTQMVWKGGHEDAIMSRPVEEVKAQVPHGSIRAEVACVPEWVR